MQDLRCTVRLYADDILIYTTIGTPEDCLLLQSDLALLQTWAEKWQMEFNPSKCLHLTISNKHHHFNHSYYISNHLIQKVFHAKYLGVIFDEHITWKNHISAKANDALAFIKRNINFCPNHIATKHLSGLSYRLNMHLHMGPPSTSRYLCIRKGIYTMYCKTTLGEVVLPLYLIGLLSNPVMFTPN